MEITDEHVKVALSRHLGDSRATAAARVGVTASQVRSWEESSWWAEVEAIAARTHNQKTLGKARKVVTTILDKALEPECASSILNQAANLSRWLIETQDPSFKSEGASNESKVLAALAQQIQGLSRKDLEAIANEPVILGFPVEDDDSRSIVPHSSGSKEASGQD